MSTTLLSLLRQKEDITAAKAFFKRHKTLDGEIWIVRGDLMEYPAYTCKVLCTLPSGLKIVRAEKHERK